MLKSMVLLQLANWLGDYMMSCMGDKNPILAVAGSRSRVVVAVSPRRVLAHGSGGLPVKCMRCWLALVLDFLIGSCRLCDDGVPSGAP